MAEKRKMRHAEYGELDAESIPFEIVKENWNEYQLPDGSVVRVRLVVSDIYQTDKTTKEGDPLIAVSHQAVVSYRPKQPAKN